MAMENGGDFAERREDLLQSIERDEEELREAMHELADVAEHKLNLTEYIRAAPLAWVIGAFCFGIWLGLGNASTPPPEMMIANRRLRR